MSLTEIKKVLKANGHPDRIEQLKIVAPGAKGAYGVRMPVINELAKEMKEGGFDLVEELWRSGAYEEKILAAKIIRLIAKQDPEKAISLVEKYADGIDNWAVCDTLGMQSLKSINKIRTKEVFDLAEKLSNSKNMWNRRLSLVLVEDFCKRPEMHPAIWKLIKKQKADKEYYIKRAVVWLESSIQKKR